MESDDVVKRWSDGFFDTGNRFRERIPNPSHAYEKFLCIFSFLTRLVKAVLKGMIGNSFRVAETDEMINTWFMGPTRLKKP